MNLSPEQFKYFQYPMFVQAKHLMRYPLPGDVEEAYEDSMGDDYEPMPEGHRWDKDAEAVDYMWGVKKEEADYRGLSEDIRQNGIETPVTLSNENSENRKFPYPGGTILNGHHRVVAANDELGPDTEVPVHWVSPGPAGNRADLRWYKADREENY
jgi:hypothetical protein